MLNLEKTIVIIVVGFMLSNCTISKDYSLSLSIPSIPHDEIVHPDALVSLDSSPDFSGLQVTITRTFP